MTRSFVSLRYRGKAHELPPALTTPAQPTCPRLSDGRGRGVAVPLAIGTSDGVLSVSSRIRGARGDRDENGLGFSGLDGFRVETITAGDGPRDRLLIHIERREIRGYAWI